MNRREFIGGGAMAAVAGFSTDGKSGQVQKERVAILSAHPDDIIACAGFLLLTKDIFEFHVIDFTYGQFGLGEQGFKDGSTKRMRMAEEEKACAMIGARLHWMGGVDGNLYATEGLCDGLVATLEQIKPRAIITHWPLDHHPDHVMTYALSMKAVSRMGKTCDDDLELYFMNEVYQQRTFHCDHVVDVTSVLEQRKKFFGCYACQSPEWNFNMFQKSGEVLGFQLRGGYTKNRTVECFAAFGKRKAGLGTIFDRVPRER